MRAIRVALGLWLWAVSVSAQTITFLDAGTDATFSTAMWTALAAENTTTQITSDTFDVYTGPRSLQLDTDADPTTNTSVTRDDVAQDSGTRCSFRVRLTDATPDDHSNFILIRDTSDNPVVNLQQMSTGVLRLVPVGELDTVGTTVLANNTWYRIAFAFVITSTATFDFRVWINGLLELSHSEVGTGVMTRVGMNKFRFTVPITWGATKTAKIDDIYCDSGSTLVDPGDVRVTAKLPTTRTQTGYATTVGTGAVNERPASATNARTTADTSGSVVTEGYAIEGQTAGDVAVAGRLLGYVCWNLTKTSAVATNGTVRILCNGASGSDIGGSLTTTDQMFFTTVTSATYPATSPVIGQSSATTSELATVEDMGVILAWVPGGGAGGLLGVWPGP